MITDKRIANEIQHGKFIAMEGEEVWNWSSPAGKIRWERRCKMFKDFLKDANKMVLEIGCGSGLFTQELAVMNHTITAIDVSPELLELAKKRVRKKNVFFKIENAYATSFKKNSFDFIVGSSVLHHLDIESALKEFYRILKPGGGLMFTEPNMMNPQVAMERNIPFMRKLMANSPDETAFFRWSIKKILVKHGFSEVSAVPFDFLHPAVPKILIPVLKPIFNGIEHIPLVREIAGSLIIKAYKR